MTSPALAGLVAALLTFPAQAEDWPRFRGINGQGVADPATPVSFDAKTLLWKEAIPGSGHGSPVVVGDRVFLQAATADDTGRVLLCLNADTGKTVWSKQTAGQKQKMHKKNSGASGTPAVDGGRVFAAVWDGATITLHALDLAGKELWAKPVGKYDSQHGAGHSPMAHAGMVYLNFDDDVAARLVAFDAATGEVKWTKPRKVERASYTTPFLHGTAAGGLGLILGTTTSVDCYDPRTGEVKWTYAVKWGGTNKPLRAVGQPIVAAENVVAYFGEGGSGRHMVAVNVFSKGEVKAPAWESREKDKTPYVPGIVTHGEHLYWVNDTGFAACASAATGKIVWYERLFPKGVTASPILVGSTVFAVCEDGAAKAFKATKEGLEVVGTSAVGEGVYASPAAARGRLYVRGMEHLFCYGKPGS